MKRFAFGLTAAALLTGYTGTANAAGVTWTCGPVTVNSSVVRGPDSCPWIGSA